MKNSPKIIQAGRGFYIEKIIEKQRYYLSREGDFLHSCANLDVVKSKCRFICIQDAESLLSKIKSYDQTSPIPAPVR